jgi:hypothetical protein
MPYSDNILNQIIQDQGFDKEPSIRCLEANRHNHITATYHLINKKQKKSKIMKDTFLKDNDI